MTGTKYGKYIFVEPRAEWESAEPREESGDEKNIRVNSNLISALSCDCGFVGVSEAGIEEEIGHPPHAHDSDELLFFILEIRESK